MLSRLYPTGMVTAAHWPGVRLTARRGATGVHTVRAGVVCNCGGRVAGPYPGPTTPWRLALPAHESPVAGRTPWQGLLLEDSCSRAVQPFRLYISQPAIRSPAPVIQHQHAFGIT